MKKPHFGKQLGAAAQQMKEEAEARHKEERYQALLVRCPPDKSFYSYSVPSDRNWRRVEELPSVEHLEQVGAEQWTGGMIGAAAGFIESFVVTGMHHDSRVLEFKYVYKDKKLLTRFY
jgi:hypothetical protein